MPTPVKSLLKSCTNYVEVLLLDLFKKWVGGVTGNTEGSITIVSLFLPAFLIQPFLCISSVCRHSDKMVDRPVASASQRRPEEDSGR